MAKIRINRQSFATKRVAPPTSLARPTGAQGDRLALWAAGEGLKPLGAARPLGMDPGAPPQGVPQGYTLRPEGAVWVLRSQDRKATFRFVRA